MINETIQVQNTNAASVYEALMDAAQHTRLTGAPAQIDARVGGAFSTFDGYATGEFTELAPPRIIEMTWRASDWADSELSTVRFELTDTADGVQIDFVQRNVPAGHEDEYRQGWHDYYFAPLAEFFVA